MSEGTAIGAPDGHGPATPPPALLSRLAPAAPAALLTGDAWVRDIVYDSRQAGPGSLFVALPGTRTDGHAHAAAAVAAGATGLLVERAVGLPVAELRVPSVRSAIGPLSSAFYGRPSDRLAVVGVTGTDGKTTVATVLRHCLDALNVPAGQIGTVGTHFGREHVPSPLTTPQAPDLQRILWQMVHAGVEAVAMEASSHGLDQRRVDGIAFDVGIFTNLSREHLDYHGTMERYFDAKTLLFQPGRCRFAVVGVDDEWGRRLAREVELPSVTFGRHPSADVRMEVSEHGLSGITVHLDGPEGATTLTSQLVGRFNGGNVVAAYLAARHLGVPAADAARGICASPPPPGRFELVDAGQPFLVVVDYAHTAVALGGLIAATRHIMGPDGRLTVVVGARGGRDRGKRPDIGRVAASADRVLLTTDSPGDEPVDSIIGELRRGTLEANGHAEVRVQPDRRRAIEDAVALARDGDAILIVGRGHETAQHVAGRTVALDDRVAAYDALASRGCTALAGSMADKCA